MNKKTTWKKLLALGLVVVMLAVTLVACGGGDNGTTIDATWKANDENGVISFSRVLAQCGDDHDAKEMFVAASRGYDMSAEDFDDDLSEELQPVTAVAEPQAEATAGAFATAAEEQQPTEPELPSLDLTEEPASDDIYIKASRRLRQYCEERLLTMDEIENEVKQNMVGVAESYSALSAEGNIPSAISQRVETLKNATDRLPEYFALGEDIAARVMFFMLYQMLSYSDRIVEQPETKERLNDFFRRYGSAGMALSLLDSGI